MAQGNFMRSAPIRRLRHPLEESPLWGVLGSVLAGALALVVGLPVLLIVCILIPFCLLARWLLLFIFWNRQSSADTQGGGPESVRGNDGRWLGSAWRYSVIHAVLIFEAGAGLDVTQLRHLLLTRVVPLYPRLTRRPVPLPLSAGAGHCWLPDSKFCIDRHVFAGPTMLTTEKQLQDYVGHLLGEGLSSDKPPWEMHVLQSVGRHEDTVAVLRVHQSVADGMALVRVLCHSLADCQVLHVPQRPHFGALAFTLNIFRACIVGPLTLLFWLLLTTEDCNILTQKKAWSGQVSVTWSAAITLPKVTRIKQVTRSTVNCVLLSALAGAARRLLQGCGVKQPPDMKVVLPVDLRADVTSPRLSSRLGSKMAPVVVGLPVGVEGAVPRLWAMRRNLDSLRTSADPVVVYVATAALMATVPGRMARKVLTAITGKATIQFSSLPGPTSTLLVGGHPLKGVYPLLPAQNSLGIAVSVFTYADQIYVAIISDSALSPAANTLLHHLHCQIEMLWQLLLHRRVPGESRSHVLLRRADVTGSPVRELRLRLTCVQEEVQRLATTCNSPSQQQSEQSSETEQQDAARLQNLKIEFSELLSELRRRNSAAVGGNTPIFEDEELGGEMWRPRRRAMSCSSSRRSSRSLVGLLTSARPASYIESNYNKSPSNPSSPVVFRPTSSVPGSARPSSYIEPHTSSSSSPLVCRAAASECTLPGAVGPLSPEDLYSSSSRDSPVSPIKHMLHMHQRQNYCNPNFTVISEHPGEVRTYDCEENVQSSMRKDDSAPTIDSLNICASYDVLHNETDHGTCTEDTSSEEEEAVHTVYDSSQISPHKLNLSDTVTVHNAHHAVIFHSTNEQLNSECAIQEENQSDSVHSPTNVSIAAEASSPGEFSVMPKEYSSSTSSISDDDTAINTTRLPLKQDLNSTNVQESNFSIKTIAQNISFNKCSIKRNAPKGPKELENNFDSNPKTSDDVTLNINPLKDTNDSDINEKENSSFKTTSNQTVTDSKDRTNKAYNKSHRHQDQVDVELGQHQVKRNNSFSNITSPKDSLSHHHSENTTNNDPTTCVDVQNTPEFVVTITEPLAENAESGNLLRVNSVAVNMPTFSAHPTDSSPNISIPERALSPSSSVTSSSVTGDRSIGYQAMVTPDTSQTVSLDSPKSSSSSTSISSVSSGRTLNSSSTFPPSMACSPVQHDYSNSIDNEQQFP